MIRRATAIACAAVALLGCADLDVTEAPHSIAVVDEYEQRFRWEQPRACDIVLHQRVTDEDSRIVEYNARVGDREMAILYTISEAGDELPLRVEVYDLSGEQPLTVEANDSDLVVRGAQGAASYEVDAYDEAPPATGIVVTGAVIEDRDALHLLGCALPLRAELGAVPAFLRNRATGGRLPDDPDIVADPEVSPPILEWDGEVTILGALLLQAACAGGDSWECPCMSWRDNIAGAVPGWCGEDPENARVYRAVQVLRR